MKPASANSKRICVPGTTEGSGGPVTFRIQLKKALRARGIEVTPNLSGEISQAILLTGGTRHLLELWQCKRAGTRVIQRLDGLNWRHMIEGNVRYKIRSSLRNRLMILIRDHLADHVIYQSDFARRWWHSWYGPAPCPESVIHNGVDLSCFQPSPLATYRLQGRAMICIEGNLEADEATISILIETHRRLYKKSVISSTFLCGNVSRTLKDRLKDVEGLKILGSITREEIRDRLMTAGIFLSLDLHPACPNSVIEALAAGVPVVGYRTGSMEELVLPNGGLLAEYKGDPWKLEVPHNLAALANLAMRILEGRENYSKGARAIAEERFDLNTMVDAYLRVLIPELEN